MNKKGREEAPYGFEHREARLAERDIRFGGGGGGQDTVRSCTDLKAPLV